MSRNAICQWRPLDRPVPIKNGTYIRSSFKSPTIAKARDAVLAEVGRLNPREEIVVVIMLDISERDIRADGQLRSDTRYRSNAVVVSFDPKRADIPALRIQCNTFSSVGCNLHAVGLVLEALRAQNRYGVGSGTEQYRGWAALPPGASSLATGGGIAAAEWATVEAAMRFLWESAGKPLGGHWPASPGEFMARLTFLHRGALSRHHPDAGGDTATASKINRCRDYIEQHMPGGGA